MNQAEIKIMGNIEKYGCHVTSVFDPKEEDPNFTYTVSVTRTPHTQVSKSTIPCVHLSPSRVSYDPQNLRTMAHAI